MYIYLIVAQRQRPVIIPSYARPGSIIINTNNGPGTYHEALTTELYRRQRDGERMRVRQRARAAEIADFTARISAPEYGRDKFYSRRRERRARCAV